MFKKGDVVRRVGGSDTPEKNIVRGREYRVVSDDGNNIEVEESTGVWSTEFFELVSSKLQFKVGDRVVKARWFKSGNYCKYGGEERDVPIGTVGVVTTITNEDYVNKDLGFKPSALKVEVAFDNMVTWSLDETELNKIEDIEYPLTKFEVGKLYRCLLTGRGKGWASDGSMDGVLDGKPHKCIRTDSYNPLRANFDCVDRGSFDTWSWGKNEFEEVSFEHQKQNKSEAIKMKPIETKFEKAALQEAKEKQIQVEVARKAEDYKREIQNWISFEKSARDYRARAD